MSVFPYLNIAHYGIDSPNYKLILQNDGIGPAMVKSVEIKDASEKTYPRIFDYIKSNLAKEDSVEFYFSDIHSGRLIPENDIIELIVISDEKIKSSKRMMDLLNDENFTLNIEYESIYEESWTISNKMISPKKN